jgi:hypothetical protein
MPHQIKRPKVKPQPPPSDFERKAHELVGRLIFTYSRLDVNLALFVADHQGYEQRDKVLEQLRKDGSFKAKLDLVLPTVRRVFPEDAECMEIWGEWLRDADALRVKRNDMIHGRWGVHEHLGEVINVRGLPSSEQQPETKYTLAQLEAEVQQAERIANMLYELRLGSWRKARWKEFYGPSKS